jgi:hypothetical protein
MPHPHALLTLTVLLAAACAPNAPDVLRVRLDEPDATYPEPFGLIQTVRPLPDGRLLVADPLGQVLLAIDMDGGTADTIGRRGGGPGEYDQPDAVFPLPGDSTLLTDLGNGRLTVLGPDLEPGPTIPFSFGDPQGGDMTFIIPRRTDGLGRFYFQGMGIKMGGPTLVSFPDSAPVMRFDRATQSIDTLAMVRLRRREAVVTGNDVDVTEYALWPEDAWDVGSDGRIAAARTAGYYVEWIDGADRRQGPNVPYAGVPVRRADQEEWIDNLFATAMSLQVGIANGVRTTSFARGFGNSNDRPGPEDYEWPDEKPPFIADGVRVSPDGEAWVHRSIPANSDVVYDVFDREGNRREQVIFPPERRVVGFAGEFVFTVRRDELDLFWLERFRRR